MDIDEAPFRQFYRPLNQRPSHPAVEWSRPARNDQVGGRRVHIRRFERLGRPAIKNKVSGKTPQLGTKCQLTCKSRTYGFPDALRASHISFSTLIISIYLSKNFSEQVTANIAYLSIAMWSDASTAEITSQQEIKSN